MDLAIHAAGPRCSASVATTFPLPRPSPAFGRCCGSWGPKRGLATGQSHSVTKTWALHVAPNQQEVIITHGVSKSFKFKIISWRYTLRKRSERKLGSQTYKGGVLVRTWSQMPQLPWSGGMFRKWKGQDQEDPTLGDWCNLSYISGLYTPGYTEKPNRPNRALHAEVSK